MGWYDQLSVAGRQMGLGPKRTAFGPMCDIFVVNCTFCTKLDRPPRHKWHGHSASPWQAAQSSPKRMAITPAHDTMHTIHEYSPYSHVGVLTAGSGMHHPDG
jgi:hypothetical protein